MKEKQYFPQPFKYCEYYVEDFLREADYTKVNMVGFHNMLLELRDMIKKDFTEVSYSTYDIEYHGWHGEAAANMHKIRDALVNRMLEIYVICQMGLGESIYEDATGNMEETNHEEN